MDKKGELEENFYEVEKILDRRKIKGKFQYLIKWKGYSLSESTWEPISHLQYVKEIVDQFNASLDKTPVEGGVSLENKENENSENKIRGRKKKILKKASKLIEDDDYQENNKEINLEKMPSNDMENQKENKIEKNVDFEMNAQRRKLRSSDKIKDSAFHFQLKDLESFKDKEKDDTKEKERSRENSINKLRANIYNKKKKIKKGFGRYRGRRYKSKLKQKQTQEKKAEEDQEQNVNENEEQKAENIEHLEEEKETIKNEENNINNEEGKLKVNENNIPSNQKMFFINEDYTQILGIKMEDKKLIAVVEKKGIDNGVKQELLSTKELKLINPWILIDYYENRINFE